MKKRGEVADARIGEPQALITSEGKFAYRQKVEAVVAKFKSLKQEAEDLEAKADRVYEENKSIFKAQSSLIKEAKPIYLFAAVGI